MRLWTRGLTCSAGSTSPTTRPPSWAWSAPNRPTRVNGTTISWWSSSSSASRFASHRQTKIEKCHNHLVYNQPLQFALYSSYSYRILSVSYWPITLVKSINFKTIASYSISDFAKCLPQDSIGTYHPKLIFPPSASLSIGHNWRQWPVDYWAEKNIWPRFNCQW